MKPTLDAFTRDSMIRSLAKWECEYCGQELISASNLEDHLDMVLEDEFGHYGTHQGYTLMEALKNSRPSMCDYCEHILSKDD